MPGSRNSFARVRQRRAFGFLFLSALIPGSVQSLAGARGVGRFARWVYGAAAVALLLVAAGAIFLRGATVALLLTPAVAQLSVAALWVLFAGWVMLLIDAWRLARPIDLPRRSRLGLTITSLVLVLGVGGVTAVGTTALAGVGTVGGVLAGGGDSEVKAGRFNVLLLGADSAADREGLRPDSINVASIDAETGRTVLIGVPRNLQRAPFPDSSPLHDVFPEGFVCAEGKCMLNGVYAQGVEHRDAYPDGIDPGLAAMKEAVGETLGLQINYHALVDMAGFDSLIDAMGGIRLDISKPIPIGGIGSKISGYIQPGNDVLLDGFHALWFARSRAESSDYERMARQKCVMSAMVAQLDPLTVATKFTALSEAGKNLVETDVARGEVYQLAELALKARALRISSVNVSPPLISAANPDFALIRKTVAEKIEASELLDAGQSPPPSSGASPSAIPTRKASPKASGDQEGHRDTYTETDDLDAVCSVPA